MHGNVYIASMNMRGAWAEKPPGATVINVTSAQGRNCANRLAFSPMTPTLGGHGYKGFYNFEHYWQQGKVYEDIDHAISIEWWRQQDTPKRRYPPGRGRRVLHANFGDGIQLDYIQSRKRIYVPEYFNLIKDSVQLQQYRRLVLNDHDVVVYDFDGPRGDDKSVKCDLISLEYLREKINDVRYPFGHGYIVAAAIAGINPNDI